MIDLVRGILILLVFFFLFGCGRSGKGVQFTSDAEQLRQYALNCLNQDKTYTLENGFDEAIEYYISKGDTAAVLEMCRLAAVRMQWLNHQDSAATYLRRALQYARPQTSPNISDLYIELSNLYAQPLLPKDYEKTIEFARHAVEASHNERGKIGVENRSRALHDMGVAYSFLGKNDSATVYLEQALALTAPHDPEYTQLALNYAADCRADSRKGIDYLNRIKGENLGKRITLGFIYLNRNQIDSAEFYLTQSQQLFDSTPDRYSINTYNNLRLLKGCVDYARQGRGFPYEGMERNDSINQRLVLNQKIEAEKTEYNTQLQIHLLESEANRQRVWLICLLLLFLGMAVAAVVYVRSKERYIKIRKELDALCLAQIEREVSTLMTLILLPLRMPSLLLLIS